MKRMWHSSSSSSSCCCGSRERRQALNNSQDGRIVGVFDVLVGQRLRQPPTSRLSSLTAAVCVVVESTGPLFSSVVAFFSAATYTPPCYISRRSFVSLSLSPWCVCVRVCISLSLSLVHSTYGTQSIRRASYSRRSSSRLVALSSPPLAHSTDRRLARLTWLQLVNFSPRFLLCSLQYWLAARWLAASRNAPASVSRFSFSQFFWIAC